MRCKTTKTIQLDPEDAAPSRWAPKIGLFVSTDADLSEEAQLQQGFLSSGAAVRLAALSVPVFLTKLADYGVSALRMNEAEIREDSQRA